MAYAFVNQGETSTGAVASTTIAVTYAPAAGNLLVIAVSWGTATGTASMADGGVGNTFTQFAAPLADGTANQSTHYFYALNCKGGSTTFTATVPSAQFRCIYVGEYSGTTGAPLNTAQQQQRLPTNGTDVVTSGNANATGQPALVWGFTNDYNAAAATAAGTGYTGRTLVWNYAGAASCSRSEDKRVTVTGNVAATFTAGANGTEEFHTIVGIFAEVTSSSGIQIGGYDNPGAGPFRAARFPAFMQGIVSAASPDVTVALTGAQAVFTAGTLTPSTSVALIGQRATFAAGTLIPNTALALTGQAATFTAGSLLAALDKALAGQAATFTAGTLTPNTAVALTGQQAVFNAGTMTASVGGDVTVAMTGQAATFAAGTLAPSADVALAGQAANFAAGTLTPSATLALTGISAAFNAGTLTAQVSGDVTVALTGAQATFTAGNLTATGGTVADAPSGGWAQRRYFLTDYEKELRRRIEEARQRQEMLEELQTIEEPISREIARLLHEPDAKNAEQEDLARLKALAAQYGREEISDLAPRVMAALTRAIAQENYSALQALDRELKRQMEEEEMAILMLLTMED